MPSATPPLPDYKHLPGINQRPDDKLLQTMAMQASPITQEADANENIAWLYGIRLIENGFYWEAHEVLEVVWMRAPHNSRERFLVQCLIQIANAALKQVLQKPTAAARLCDMAEQCRQRAFPINSAKLMGFSASQLDNAIGQCRVFEGSVRLAVNDQ